MNIGEARARAQAIADATVASWNAANRGHGVKVVKETELIYGWVFVPKEQPVGKLVKTQSVTTHIAHPRSQSASPLLPRAYGRREGPSEVTSSHSVRAERRDGCLLGFTSFLRTHTRPTVARERSTEVYRAVREARKILLLSESSRTGKGLT